MLELHIAEVMNLALSGMLNREQLFRGDMHASGASGANHQSRGGLFLSLEQQALHSNLTSTYNFIMLD